MLLSGWLPAIHWSKIEIMSEFCPMPPGFSITTFDLSRLSNAIIQTIIGLDNGLSPVWQQVHCVPLTLQWLYNERDGVSNHQPYDCSLNRLFRQRSKKTSKLRVTGLCEGNSPVTVNSPHKWPVTRKKVSIWWRHHGCPPCCRCLKRQSTERPSLSPSSTITSTRLMWIFMSSWKTRRVMQDSVIPT